MAVLINPCRLPRRPLRHCGAVSVTADAAADTEAMMAKLTDTQLIVLSKAAQRDDGAAQLPSGMPKPAARKLAAALVAKKLMRELRSKPDMPVWRQDDEDHSLSLIILKAGRDAIGLIDDAARDITPKAVARQTSTRTRKKGVQDAGAGHGRAASDKQPDTGSGTLMPGSKRSQVISMLSVSSGATIAELAAATSWLPHTTRAVLTGLRKEGYSIERQRLDGATASTYRIVKQSSKAG